MVEIEIIQGDITKIEADAIVNAANSRLIMGGGVAGAIRRAGGDEINEEAIKKGPIPIGEAAVTGAGRLKAKYVIHGAVMGLDFYTDADKIKAATENSLKRAEELKLKSIAFPAFGTGVGGFPVDECAKIMLDVAKDFKYKSLAKIIFVLFDKKAYETFVDELDKDKN